MIKIIEEFEVCGDAFYIIEVTDGRGTYTDKASKESLMAAGVLEEESDEGGEEESWAEDQMDEIYKYISKKNMDHVTDGFGTLEDGYGNVSLKNEDYKIMIDIIEDDEDGNYFNISISERFGDFEETEKSTKRLATVKSNIIRVFGYTVTN